MSTETAQPDLPPHIDWLGSCPPEAGNAAVRIAMGYKAWPTRMLAAIDAAYAAGLAARPKQAADVDVPPVRPLMVLPDVLAAIDNALRNGSYMTGANLAFEMLCDHLGVDRGRLEFRPDWHAQQAEGSEPNA